MLFSLLSKRKFRDDLNKKQKIQVMTFKNAGLNITKYAKHIHKLNDYAGVFVYLKKYHLLKQRVSSVEFVYLGN